MRVQLASTLQGVVTQNLMPTADGLGRTAALEVLMPDDAVRNLIRQAKVEQIYSVMQTSTSRGMQTMEQSLADLIQRGVVTFEAGLTRSSRPAQLIGLLERAIALEPGNYEVLQQREYSPAEIRTVRVEKAVQRYIASIVRKTRESRDLVLGASPRATIALAQASRAHAFLRGRAFVTPDDVKAMAKRLFENKSLLVADTEGAQARYRQLETIREYGL